MRKVLIIGPTEYQGGIESFSKRLIKELSGDFSFSLLQFRDEKIVDSEYYENTLKIPIYKVVIPQGIKGKLKRRKIAMGFFKDNKFDVVHINTNSPDTYYWAQAAIKFGIRVIYQSHNGATETLGGKYVPQILMNLLRRHQRNRLLSLNTYNVQVSDIAGKWMFGDQYDKTKTVVNGIDVKKFVYSEVERNKLRLKLNISTEDNVILIASRLVKQKNIFRALDILEEGIKEKKFDKALIIGEGDQSKELQLRIKRLSNDIQDKIKYYGVQSNIQAWLSTADVLLMPSLYEGLPYSVVEAQANGLPIVLSSTITKQVRLTNLVTFVDLKEPNVVWINAISEQLKQNSYRNEYGRKIEASSFSIQNFKKQFLDMYNDAMRKVQ